MDWTLLAYTTPDVIEKIKLAEKEGRFSDHLDPPCYDDCLPVTEKFPYIPSPFLRLLYWWRKIYFLNGLIKLLNTKVFNTEVKGREKLKGLEGCVVVCNHINKYDALVVNYALGNKKLKIMTADFNNRPGFLGKMMRADGILPFKNERKCIKKFTEAVDYYLKNGTSVLFFPEGSEWWCYKKVRPFMDGAFHFAAKNNVPVLPVYITFRPSGRCHEGVELPYFTVNIMDPIACPKDMTKSEASKYLKEEAIKAYDRKYEEVYEKDYVL